MLSDYDIQTLCQAFQELNSIRARDGVPYTHLGYKSCVDQEYFSEIVDRLNILVEKITGKSAHCHPTLYKTYNLN